ncbi:MAG: ABC transporter substrate-binding protein [Eubacteriales bacterium]|nr:ABC transporter substrate-binding protein [Eubacteriales bacterium]
MSKHKKRALALLLAALCLLSACGGDGGDEDGRPVDNVKVSTAYFGLAYYQNGTLNPVMDGTGLNRLVCEALYEGLFEVSGNFTAQNVLCADYTGDGTTFAFTLRDDVTFWSGAKLTAADVVSSLRAARDNEDSPYHNRMVEVSSIEAASDSEVRVTLSSPNINFPRLLDIPIYRQGSAEGDFADGTGPFKPVQENGAWSLQANESWHGGFLGSIRHITLVTMTRADAAASSFQTGDVSLMREPRIAPDGTSTKFGGSVDTVRTASADLHYLGVNHGSAALANAKVRQALSAALGRQSLCDVQLQSFAVPAALPVNPQPVSDGLSYSLTADTEAAARLLDEAGLEEPLSVRLLVNGDNSFKAAAADQIAASWRAIGVTVTVDKQPYETFLSMLREGSFDVYYGETLLTPDFDLRPLLSPGGSLNYGGYSSETVSGAIAAARRGEDVAALYRLLLEQMPIIPVAFECGQLILRKGLIDEFTPAPYNAFAGLEAWTSEG